MSLQAIDWRGLLVPTVHPLELVLRGTIVYLVILAALRILRREGGALSTPDLVVIVLVADAAQNAMAANYHSISEGLILVCTIFGWNYLLDWLGYRSPWVRRLLRPEPLLLVKEGQVNRRNMRAELLTMDDLMQQLRGHGVENVSEVKRCYIEPDGNLSVIKWDKKPDDDSTPKRSRGIAG